MRLARPGGVTRLVFGLSLVLVGCGPGFDPPSELHSLRVLAVQKDVPYAQPGDTVHLQMLWQDASPSAPRPVTVTWFPPCFDPAGDLFYGCFTDRSIFGALPQTDPNQPELASFVMPSDIISRKPPIAPPNAPYGLAYLFFAVCAGQLTVIPQTAETAFPLGCKAEDGTLLGADDFVAGYASVYSFKTFSNKNPVISGFEFNGQRLDTSGTCQDTDCLAIAGSVPAADFECSEHPERCIPTCADDGDPKCPAYKLNPVVDKNKPDNQEQDSVSAKLLGRNVGEQMWIDYYTEKGSFKSPVRLLNDATSGWNDNYGTDFYAPKQAGPFRVWSVVHDNRGGVAWAGVTLKAE